MSSSHHADGSNSSGGRDNDLMKRFLQQTDGTAKRHYEAGRLGAYDEGSLVFAVTADPRSGCVIVDFGKPVQSMGLRPADVEGLIKLLLDKVKELGQPVTLTI